MHSLKKKIHERCFELIIKIKGILYSSHFGKCFGFAVSGYSVHTDCLMWSYRLIINDWSVLLLIQKGTLSGPRWEIWHLVTSSRSISTLMLSICISPQSTYRFHKVTRYYVHYYLLLFLVNAKQSQTLTGIKYGTLYQKIPIFFCFVFLRFLVPAIDWLNP